MVPLYLENNKRSSVHHGTCVVLEMLRNVRFVVFFVSFALCTYPEHMSTGHNCLFILFI